MGISSEPTVLLSPLPRADGSAEFSQNGYTVLGAVNGPIEVQRRDELPEEAAIDVIVRPAAGVGGTRERHLEAILQSTLRQIIHIHNFPRTLIQITLQITNTPENYNAWSKLVQASSNLPLLPALLQTSVLTLLSASIPLSMTMTSVLLALNDTETGRSIIENPTPLQCQDATSIHIFAFTSHGDLLVAESEGPFELDDWEEVFDHAKRLCCDGKSGDDDVMEEDKGSNLMMFVKSAVQEKVANDLHWKG
ncbi:exosome non-catalytic core subunit rrp46 [Clarireedia jacksonii]